MDLHHLRTFVTVAEEAHLTRAAERLFTSQPAISAHIKALEEELGVSLFERTPKGMKLTPAGIQLLGPAQQALGAARAFLDHARGLRDELLGAVNIGLNSDARFLRLTDIQRALSTRYPRLEVAFLSGSTQTNLRALRTGRLDACFMSGDCDDAQIETFVIDQEIMAVAAPKGLCDGIDVTDVVALAGLPWVYTSPDCEHYKVMRSIFEAHGCEPVKTVVADQEDAVLAMVTAGFGLGIVRRDDALRAAQEGSIEVLPTALAPVKLRFAMLAKRANDPVLRAVADVVAGVWALEDAAARRAG